MIREWFRKLFSKQQDKPLPKPEEKREDPNIEYMGYTMVDEESGFLLSVLMVCGCGNPAVRAKPESNDYFYCLHCDRPCEHEKPCAECIEHFLFDAEGVRAEGGQFYYSGEEEEEEEQ
jgi:hypothetical protein